MRVYTKIRNMLSANKDTLLRFEKLETKLADHDDKILLIFEYLKQFEEVKQQQLEQNNRKRIGFKKSDK